MNPIESMTSKRGGAAAPELSIVIPIYDEEGNIPLLMERVFSAGERLGRSFEVIGIDDGSSDGSAALLRLEAARRPALKVIRLSRNYGQTAAIMAGIDHSQGNVIVSLDADLQNDPEDISLLLGKLDEGYDVVSGWRRDRKDAALRRNFMSRVANSLISRISGVALHDYGCTLKAYRRRVLQGVRLYGEMHRFIPIYAAWYGARISEVVVRHYPRHSGHSKYGLERILKVVLDLIVVKFLDRYLTRPIYTFGGFGLLSLFMSGVAFLTMVYWKVIEGVSMISTPMPLLTAMTFLVGIMSILMGLLAEIMMRVYFEAQQRRIYSVREMLNFDRT
jgi:glycosyltransferase involved in cell wall biosynthesis